jgi:NDP-sugar pyrophosphorylase family protein
MNIVIPMAGAGTRFSKEGYVKPKPLIDILGETMIQKVVNNIGIEANYIFIVQREHAAQYDLLNYLLEIKKNSTIVFTDKLTEGAACTVLLAESHINNDSPLLICDSDSLLSYNSQDFLKKIQSHNGAVITFHGQDEKYSYAKVIDEKIVKIAEKNKISEHAIAGRYHWAKGKDFVYYAKMMITKNLRINNEFYVAPVYNLAIKEGFRILNYHIDEFQDLGTPENLKKYIYEQGYFNDEKYNSTD